MATSLSWPSRTRHEAVHCRGRPWRTAPSRCRQRRYPCQEQGATPIPKTWQAGRREQHGCAIRVVWLVALVDRLSELGVSMAHWTGRNTKKPSVSARRQKDIRRHSVQNVRKRILQDGLVPYVCAECDMLPKWNGKPLTFHMDQQGKRLRPSTMSIHRPYLIA